MTRLLARTPADLAAFAPLALGFVPERSVVMISVGSAGGMHARVDLPHDPDDVDDVVEALLRPARANGVKEVVVMVYDDDTTVADEAAWSLHEELTAAGIRVREVLRVHDGHWYAVLPGAPLAAYRGVPFELAEHAFTAQGVFDGRVTHASREALRATIDEDPSAARALEPAVAEASPMPPGSLEALVRGRLEHGSTFSSSELAALAVSLPLGDLRDEAWTWLERADARRAVDLWSDAVRRVAREPRRRPGRGARLRGLARRRRRPGVVRGRPVPGVGADPLAGRSRRPAARLGDVAGPLGGAAPGAGCPVGPHRGPRRVRSPSRVVPGRGAPD